MVFKLYTHTCSPEGFLSESGPCHWHVPHLAQRLSGPCVGLLLFPMESNPLQKFLGPAPYDFYPAGGVLIQEATIFIQEPSIQNLPLGPGCAVATG